jgi:hypothetical protein
MKLVWQKVTQKQKLAKVATDKKKEAAWEPAIPVEGGRNRRPKEPEWVALKVEKENRSSSDLVIRSDDRRHKNLFFDGQNCRETFDYRGRRY